MKPSTTNTISEPAFSNQKLVIAGITGLTLFLLIALLVFGGTTTSVDKNIITKAQQWESEVATKLMFFITFLGNYAFLVPANLLLITFLLIRKEKRLAAFTTILAVSSLGWKFLLKEFFHRPRPDEAIVTGIKNFSFPSGHAMMGLAFYGLLILFIIPLIRNKQVQKIMNLLLFLLILLIGGSRIYLRVHYPTDVVAGYCFEIAWISLCFYLFANTGIVKKKNQGL
jgi:membrane-associated phospholipid phosphatase